MPTSIIKHKILKNAAHNSLKEPPVIPGETDNLGQMWLKLNSIADLDEINDLLSIEHKKILAKKSKRKDIEGVINAGVTFAFFYNSQKQLEFNY